MGDWLLALNGRHSGARVALDAMGGDHAPHAIVEGAAEAVRRGADVVLVGREPELRPLVEATCLPLPVVDAGQVIAMDEPVTQAARKRDSSLHVAMRLVANGEAQACVSAGNSAAIMAVALKELDRQSGIDRPAFGGFVPCRGGSAFVLDIGANSTVKPENLVQFAVLGEVYTRIALGMDRPRVALLSNGTEESKGTKESKEAFGELEKLDLNFIGNVEANQVFEGRADVVVTDGFTGNVFLKGAEGAVAELIEMIRYELTSDLVSKMAAAVLRPAFGRVTKRVNYEEVGGAPVLGVNGVVINCHGRSTGKAITNAVFLAERMAQQQLVERTGVALHAEAVGPSRSRRLVRALHLRHE